MPLHFFYTMVQKKSKTTKNSNQGGSCLKPKEKMSFENADRGRKEKKSEKNRKNQEQEGN